MNDKKLVKFIGGVVIAFVMIFLLVSLASKGVKEEEAKNDKEYQNYVASSIDDKIAYLDKTIKVTESTPRKASIELTPTSLYDELPAIDKYPFQVEGDGSINIEIFASPEKATPDNKEKNLYTDDWLINVAQEFNHEGFQIDGQSISVSVRSMSSGQGADYIVSGKYLPDAYTPSSAAWGSLITAQGGEVTAVSDRLVGNVAGIVVNKDTKKKLEDKYGKADINAVIQAVVNNEMVMGYTNPLASSTGLNFLLYTLKYYDANNILSDKATQGFTAFQNNIPYVAYTTMQMNQGAATGKLDGMILEYQTYINNANLKGYEFIPFGYRHDNPLYAVGQLSADKSAVLDKFAQYCFEEKAQKLATENGFNAFDEYTGETMDFDGATMLSAQKLWKDNKDKGKEVVAVFVADTSGSMDGEPLNQLKKSLINGAQYIKDDCSVGLVSYSDDVNIDVPIGKFDLNQRAYFQGAVEDMQSNGGTSTYDGITVAVKMLLEAKKNSPNAKLMLFLLSDGEQNVGNAIEYVSPLIKESKIPIYTIGYNANIEALESLSNINEASSINADSEDVIYRIKSLFNAQM